MRPATTRCNWRAYARHCVAVTVALCVAAPASADEASVTRTSAIVRELVAISYPELARKRIDIHEFEAESDYFRTTFVIHRFFAFMPMRYVIKVNADVWSRQAPEESVRAILVHELAHVQQLSHGMRVRRLGLMRLLFDRSEARFERTADLIAIERGFGRGLRVYREWLYRNIPPGAERQKRRNYFSPEEIDAIDRRTRERPDLFHYWRRKVPMNLTDIESAP